MGCSEEGRFCLVGIYTLGLPPPRFIIFYYYQALFYYYSNHSGRSGDEIAFYECYFFFRFPFFSLSLYSLGEILFWRIIGVCMGGR